MTKSLAFFSPDGSAPPSSTYGSVPPGTTSDSRTLILRNTGTEPIPSVRMWIEQASTADGEYRAVVGSHALTAIPQEMLSVPLPAGGSLEITEFVITPAGLSATGPDSATLVYEFDQ